MLTSRGIEANPEKWQAIISMKQPESLKEMQSLTGSTTNPGQAGRGKAPGNLPSRHRRGSGRSTSSGKRKGARIGVLRKQNPPRRGAEVPKAGKSGLRPHRGHQKASAVFSSPPDCGKDRPAAEANPLKARSR
ncbi:hypothetical protein PIB30_101533 [Stylosanthes scabra]|uniref:Uncharacterized protein n=1 Tax=Stylosanthes scabra TaxID=79078 RepID=A0ABU6XU80_9FABA|nr:hypothetical protein [Stylosanthes scabra]